MIQEVVKMFSGQNARESLQAKELVRCVADNILRVLAHDPCLKTFLVIECNQKTKALCCPRDVYWFVLTP
jgi:hypothetical protein